MQQPHILDCHKFFAKPTSYKPKPTGQIQKRNQEMLPLLIKETRTPNSINIFRKVNAERI
jgi:hypothetical protein